MAFQAGKADARKRAKFNAYALLRQRPQSEQEIRSRLKLKGYDTVVIEEVITALKTAGEVDDKRFARIWVESRMQSSPAGDVVLRHELKIRGVSAAIIEEVLEAKSQAYDEYELVLPMARERFNRMAKLDKRKAIKRLYDFLTRKGFAFTTIDRVIGELKIHSQKPDVGGSAHSGESEDGAIED